MIEFVRHIDVCCYKAFDGKEFGTKDKCLEYEQCKRNAQPRIKAKERIDQIEIKDARDYLPYVSDTNSDFDYYWYKVGSSLDMEDLNLVFELNIPFEGSDIICIEYDSYSGTCHYTRFSEIKNRINELYKVLNIK